MDSPLRERMIFSSGARRSGTWWLQRIVAAHPDVSRIPSETALFSNGLPPLLEREDRFLAAVHTGTLEDLRALVTTRAERVIEFLIAQGLIEVIPLYELPVGG